jgi:hypothetical protein
MSEMTNLLGKPGESVPVVDATELKSLWENSQSVKVPIDGSFALGYRLHLLKTLQAAWVGGEPSAIAFKVAARIDMKWSAFGVVHDGLMFDMQKFLEEVNAEEMLEKLGLVNK